MGSGAFASSLREVEPVAMSSKLVCAFATVWTACAVSEGRAKSADVEAADMALSRSAMAAGLLRFRVVHEIGNTSSEPCAVYDEYVGLNSKLPKDLKDAATTNAPLPSMETIMREAHAYLDGFNHWHKKFSSVPSRDPMWAVARKKLKAMMLAADAGSREWNVYAEKKDWVGFNKKSCGFIGGSTLIPEPGKSTVRPTDAFYCGHPAVDWSGEQFGGKPINDLCHAEVGDASKPSLCGKYTDKELVLGLAVSPLDVLEDARNVNVMTVDCLMDIVDGDIYYCQKCAGRCNG